MMQGVTGGKPGKLNQRSQARENAKARKEAQASSSSQVTKEPTLEELFSGIQKSWAYWQIVGLVIDQGKKDICWAICLARLLQALYNKENQHDQITFSFMELVAHVKREGMLKTPTKGVGRAGDKGKKIKENFDLYEDMDSSSIREKLDRFPVALRLEIEPLLSANHGEIYYLPKKKIITKNTRLHCIVLIAYGETEEGELFFIGQNSWGKGWRR